MFLTHWSLALMKQGETPSTATRDGSNRKRITRKRSTARSCRSKKLLQDTVNEVDAQTEGTNDLLEFVTLKVKKVAELRTTGVSDFASLPWAKEVLVPAVWRHLDHRGDRLVGLVAANVRCSEERRQQSSKKLWLLSTKKRVAAKRCQDSEQSSMSPW